MVLAGGDVHYPHIESTPKCRDKIVPIYQRVGGDRLVTRIALDLERYVLSKLRHLTILQTFKVGDTQRFILNQVSLLQERLATLHARSPQPGRDQTA